MAIVKVLRINYLNKSSIAKNYKDPARVRISQVAISIKITYKASSQVALWSKRSDKCSFCVFTKYKDCSSKISNSLGNVLMVASIMSGPEGWNYFSITIAKVLEINYLNNSSICKIYKDYYTWIFNN